MNMAGGIRAWKGFVAEGVPEAGTAYFPEGADVVELTGLAWKLEDGSRRYYDGLVKQVDDPEALKVLGSLAAAEDHHKATLEEFGNRVAPGKKIQLTVDAWRESAGEYMEGGMRVQEALDWSRSRRLPELLEMAISLESNAYDLYLKMAGRIEGEGRELFLTLCEEEKQHLERLTDLLEQKF